MRNVSRIRFLGSDGIGPPGGPGEGQGSRCILCGIRCGIPGWRGRSTAVECMARAHPRRVLSRCDCQGRGRRADPRRATRNVRPPSPMWSGSSASSVRSRAAAPAPGDRARARPAARPPRRRWSQPKGTASAKLRRRGAVRATGGKRRRLPQQLDILHAARPVLHRPGATGLARRRPAGRASAAASASTTSGTAFFRGSRRQRIDLDLGPSGRAGRPRTRARVKRHVFQCPGLVRAGRRRKARQPPSPPAPAAPRGAAACRPRRACQRRSATEQRG